MKKILFIVIITFVFCGCYDSEAFKSRIDSLKIANAKIESGIKDFQLKITVENNRLDRERQQREQIERDKRISGLKTGINGTYNVGNTSCTITNGKITWAAGKGYNTISFNGDLYGNKSYYEYNSSGYMTGEFIFYQDYSKGTYMRRDGVSFDVSKILN